MEEGREAERIGFMERYREILGMAGGFPGSLLACMDWLLEVTELQQRELDSWVQAQSVFIYK